MAYFKKLQQNKERRIKNYYQRPGCVHYDPVVHDPAITKEVVFSNRREVRKQIVRERFMERECKKSEHKVELAVEVLVDAASKLKDNTGTLHAYDDVQETLAKCRGRPAKNGFKLPKIIVSGPNTQRSRLRTWTWPTPRPMARNNWQRQISVDSNMNNASNGKTNSTKLSDFDRKRQKIYEDSSLPKVISKPRAATFTVGCLDASVYDNSRRPSLPIKIQPPVQTQLHIEIRPSYRTSRSLSLPTHRDPGNRIP